MKAQRSYRGVTCFEGMPGSGKTYGLAEVGLREMRAGREVWSNEGFDLAGSKIFSSFDDFMAIPNGATVCWDELPLYVNSRKWAEFPDGLLYRMTQIRKDGLRLYYSAIDSSMVDANMRRVTFWWWKCQSITSRFMVRRLYPHETFRKKDARQMRTEWVRVRPAVADAYDTMSKVAVESHVVSLGKRSGTWSKGGTGAPAVPGTSARSGAAPQGAVGRQARQAAVPPGQQVRRLPPGRRSALLVAEDHDGAGQRRPQLVPLPPGEGQGSDRLLVHGSGGHGGGAPVDGQERNQPRAENGSRLGR